MLIFMIIFSALFIFHLVPFCVILLFSVFFPAVVVEQESPAAFKNQLDRLAPVACRNAPPPPIGVILHEEVYQLFIKTRQDKGTFVTCFFQ